MTVLTSTANHFSLPPTTVGDVLTTDVLENEKKYEDFTEVKVALLIDRIYVPVVVALGLAGNMLSFLTLVFSPLRHTSTCVYMAAIAVLDSVILVLDLCVLIRGYTGHTQFYLSNGWACGFHNFLFYFAIHFDVLLLLAMTIDRFIVVRFPFKAPTLCTPRTALKAVASVGVFSFALNIHIFFTRRLGDSGNPDDPLRCWYPNPEVDYFMKKIYTWIDASIYSFIPFLSLFVLNVLIIKQLKASRKFNKQFTDGRRQANSSSKKYQSEDVVMNSELSETSDTDINLSGELNSVATSLNKTHHRNTQNNPSGRKTVASVFTISKREKRGPEPGPPRRRNKSNSNITVMFLLVSFTFLVLTSPVVIVLLYKRYYWLPSTPADLARARLTHAVVDNLMYTNHAVNFLLYCISGSRFRQELKQLLTPVTCCCRQR